MSQQKRNLHEANQIIQRQVKLTDFQCLINKLKLLINLQISTTTQQPLSLPDTTNNLIQTSLKLFKHFRQKKQQTQKQTSMQQQQRLHKQMQYCQQIVKVLQMKIIQAVEDIMKEDKEKISLNQDQHGNTGNKQDSINLEQIYQQFYIMGSMYLSKCYDCSNKLCLVLSQEVQSLTSDYKQPIPSSATTPLLSASAQPQAPPNKTPPTPDYYLLKHLLQKVHHAKKTFQSQRLLLQYQLNQLKIKVQKQQTQILNLQNSKQELIQDLAQLEQAVENGVLENAKQILQKYNSNKKQQFLEVVDSSQRKDQYVINISNDKNTESKTNYQSLNQISKQINQQLYQLRTKNQDLTKQNNHLTQKLQQYKGQLYRSAWIISMQNRQITQNTQKIKYIQSQLQQQQQPRNPIKYKNQKSSIMSFNPNRNSMDRKSSYELFKDGQHINESIVFENGNIKDSQFPKPQALFQVVNIGNKQYGYKKDIVKVGN